MRLALGIVVLWLLVLFGFPFAVFGVLHVKREEWLMKVKRLIGGLFVAVLLAVLMSQTVDAFYVECGIWTWPFCW